MKREFAYLMLLVLLISTQAIATVPHIINYQGYLSDISGMPLEGTYALEFRIYNVASGGDPAIWTEPHPTVAVTDGVFSVLLGSLVDLPPSVMDEEALWIGVTVVGDSEIEPRLKVTSVPWAYRAAVADSAVVAGAGGGEGGTVTQIDTGSGLSGGPITTSGTISVASDGIMESHIANHAVTGAQIAPNSIYTTHIIDNSIDQNDIKRDAILAFHIEEDAVGSEEIATDAVGSDEIVADAVGESEIQDYAIHYIHMADNSIASNHILNGSVTDEDLDNESGVASAHLTAHVSLPTGSNVAVMYCQITCPSSGFILANASAYAYIPHSSGITSAVQMCISQEQYVMNENNDVFAGVPSSDSSGTRYFPMSCTDVFPVPGGGSGFFITAKSVSGSGNQIRSGSLTLMFVPTAYGNVPTAPSEISQQFIEE